METPNIIAIKNLKELQDLISSEKRGIIVDWYAKWCAPCCMISSYYEKLAKELSASICFTKVDVDIAEDAAKHYQISSLPTFMAFKQEKPLDTFTAASKEKLTKMVNDLLYLQ
jgi:thioredoxin 1